jgi:hypothetical protein
MSVRTVEASPYYTIQVDATRGLLRLVRTGVAYPSLSAIAEDREVVGRVISQLPGHLLLLDMRAGPPPRSDEAFERAMAKGRKAITQRFRRVAVLVRSAVGKLQVQRLVRADGDTPHAFQDEQEALDYLVK